jgi:hypothetical protein
LNFPQNASVILVVSKISFVASVSEVAKKEPRARVAR